MLCSKASNSVHDRFQVLRRRHEHLEHEAILARHPVGFDDVRNLTELLQAGFDVLVRGSQPYQCHQAEPQRSRVDPGAIAFNDAGLLETLDALGDRRLGQSNRTAKLGQGHTRIRLERLQDPEILAVYAP